jgi:hypothetical protein
VWDTYEDFLNDNEYLLISRAIYEFTTFSYGLASNYMIQFPEVKFLEEDKKD